MLSRRHVSAVALLLACAIPLTSCLTQKTPGPAQRQTFDGGEEGWVPYGTEAVVGTTQEPAHVKAGRGALALRYVVRPAQYGSAVLPVEVGSLANLAGLRFWLKTDVATAVAVALTEKPPGGVYAAWFWSPREAWQQVQLEPSDFVLNEGPDFPPDPDGRLGADRIQAVGVVDLGPYFQTLGPAAASLAVDNLSGPHALYIDEFEFLTGVPSREARPAPVIVGRLDRGFLTWLTLGGATLSVSRSGNPLGKAALEVRYEQAAGRHVLISHGLLGLKLGGAERLSFDIASEREAVIKLYLEERRPGNGQGPRYELQLEAPANRQAARQMIRLGELKLDEGSPADDNQRLDPDLLKAIYLIDLTRPPGGQSRPNVLWISELEAQAGQ